MLRQTVTKTRQTLAATLKRVERRGERVLVQNRGETVAAIISTEDLALLERLDKRDLADARRILTRTQHDKTVAWEDLKKEIRR